MELAQAFGNSLLSTARSLLPFAPLILFCLIAEKIWATYKVRNRDIIINITYTIVTLTTVHGFILPTFYKINQYVPHNLTAFSVQSMTATQKFGYWLFYLAVFDLLYYWFHRAQHTFPWMWRYHMLHHIDRNISSTAFAKHHWLEDVWRYAFITAPVLLLFDVSQGMPYYLTVVIASLAIFMHWNTPLRFGPLERIVITPHYHRIHHSIERQHYNKNFGAIFQIWDHLFGTRHLPRKGEFPHTGVEGFDNRDFLPLILPVPLYSSARLNSDNAPKSPPETALK